MRTLPSLLLCLSLLPLPVRADETTAPLAQPPPANKGISPGMAVFASLAAVIGGYVAGGIIIGLDTSSTVFPVIGGSVAGLSIILGPSLGRALGGDGDGALRRILIRTGIVAGGTGLTVLMAYASEGYPDYWSLGAILVANAAVAGVITLAIVDVATTPSAIRRKRGQEASLFVTPTALGPHLAPGVMLGGTF